MINFFMIAGLETKPIVKRRQKLQRKIMGTTYIDLYRIFYSMVQS